jgi:hypothetical protein
MTRLLTGAILALFLALGLAACEQEGPAERAGENIGQAAEDAGEEIDEAMEEAEEEVEDATDR